MLHYEPQSVFDALFAFENRTFFSAQMHKLDYDQAKTISKRDSNRSGGNTVDMGRQSVVKEKLALSLRQAAVEEAVHVREVDVAVVDAAEETIDELRLEVVDATYAVM